jgi:hypothetical protein
MVQKRRQKEEEAQEVGKNEIWLVRPILIFRFLFSSCFYIVLIESHYLPSVDLFWI